MQRCRAEMVEDGGETLHGASLRVSGGCCGEVATGVGVGVRGGGGTAGGELVLDAGGMEEGRKVKKSGVVGFPLF